MIKIILALKIQKDNPTTEYDKRVNSKGTKYSSQYFLFQGTNCKFWYIRLNQ